MASPSTKSNRRTTRYQPVGWYLHEQNLLAYFFKLDHILKKDRKKLKYPKNVLKKEKKIEN